MCVCACIWGVADPSPLVYNYYYGAPSGISPEMPAEIREPLVCVVCVCVGTEERPGVYVFTETL